MHMTVMWNFVSIASIGFRKKEPETLKINIQGDKPMFADFLAGVH